MRELHSHIYYGGNIGLSNARMSIECAAVYGRLSDRRVFVYGAHPLQHSKKFFDDLFDCPANLTFVREEAPNPNIPIIPPYGSGIVYANKKEVPEDFLVGRPHLHAIRHLRDQDKIATGGPITLAFYSNVFYMDEDTKEVVYNYIKDGFRPKQHYIDIAEEVIWELIANYGNEFNSVHIRRGDRLGGGQPDIPCQYIVDKFRQSFHPDELLLIHSDEQDRSWFQPLLDSEYKKIAFCEDYLKDYELDGAESGLVSMIIASISKDFIGTICSTFTSYINRMRMYAGRTEEFKYLFPMFGVPLDMRGCMVYKNGYNVHKSTWSQLEMGDMMNISFWAREWPELQPKRLGGYRYVAPQPFLEFVTEEPKKQVTTDMILKNVITPEEQAKIVVLMNQTNLNHEGGDAKHYGQSWGSGFPLEHPMFAPIIARLTPQVEQVFGLELEPSGLYARIYRNGGYLGAHVDRDDLQYTASACIVEPEKPWFLFVEGDEATQGAPYAINIGALDAAVMNGTQKRHWRDTLNCDDDDMGMYVFFHWKKREPKPSVLTPEKWYHIEDGFVSPELLAEIDTLLPQAEYTESMVKEGELVHVNPAVRSNRTARMETIPQRLRDIIYQLDKKVCELIWVGMNRLEGMQILLYVKGQYFTPHLDCNFSPPNDREYTHIIYLSDVESGGQTNFPNAGVKVEAKAGRLVIWRNMENGQCNPNTMHESIPVYKGKKKVMVNWIFQQPKS